MARLSRKGRRYLSLGRDGTITQSATIHIDRVEFSLGPKDGMSEDCSAFLQVELHGADVRVYLRDSKIQLLRRHP